MLTEASVTWHARPCRQRSVAGRHRYLEQQAEPAAPAAPAEPPAQAAKPAGQPAAPRVRTPWYVGKERGTKLSQSRVLTEREMEVIELGGAPP